DWHTTHPPMPRRQEDAAAEATRVARAAPAPVAATPADFLRRLDGLVIGADPAQGVVTSDNRVLHPALGFTVAFPTGWDVVNIPAYIAARPPDGPQTSVVLAVVGQGDDPAAALDASVRARVGPDGIARRTISGLPALHVVGNTAADDGTPVVVDF